MIAICTVDTIRKLLRRKSDSCMETWTKPKLVPSLLCKHSLSRPLIMERWATASHLACVLFICTDNNTSMKWESEPVQTGRKLFTDRTGEPSSVAAVWFVVFKWYQNSVMCKENLTHLVGTLSFEPLPPVQYHCATCRRSRPTSATSQNTTHRCCTMKRCSTTTQYDKTSKQYKDITHTVMCWLLLQTPDQKLINKQILTTVNWYAYFNPDQIISHNAQHRLIVVTPTGWL